MSSANLIRWGASRCTRVVGSMPWDGVRAIAETESNGTLRLYSRRHNDFTKRFPRVAHALAVKTKAVLDGEICALDEQGFPRFEWLVNRGPQKGTLIYYVFDLLKLGEVDLRGEPQLKRKKLLANLVKGHQRILYVDHMKREGLAMYAGALTLGLEGVVAKDAKTPYVEGPAENRFWLKIKNKDSQRKEPVEFRQNKRR